MLIMLFYHLRDIQQQQLIGDLLAKVLRLTLQQPSSSHHIQAQLMYRPQKDPNKFQVIACSLGQI